MLIISYPHNDLISEINEKHVSPMDQGCSFYSRSAWQRHQMLAYRHYLILYLCGSPNLLPVRVPAGLYPGVSYILCVYSTIGANCCSKAGRLPPAEYGCEIGVQLQCNWRGETSLSKLRLMFITIAHQSALQLVAVSHNQSQGKTICGVLYNCSRRGSKLLLQLSPVIVNNVFYAWHSE